MHGSANHLLGRVRRRAFAPVFAGALALSATTPLLRDLNGPKQPACTEGRYAVQGEPLIPGGAPSGGDAVVLEPPGLESSVTQVLVKSGCPEAPADLEQDGNKTRVTSDFSHCNGYRDAVNLDATVDDGCRTMSGKFQPKQGPPRKFTAVRMDYSTVIDGRVIATHAGAPLPIPGALATLRDRASGAVVSGTATTNAEGYFKLPPHGEGSYDLCASADGFPLTCDPDPVVIGASDPAGKFRLIAIAVDGQAIHGRVLLADGTPCFARGLGSGKDVRATVGLASQGSRTVTANARAEYVLPGITTNGTYSLHAVCQAAEVTQSAPVGADELAGTKAVDLTIPNHPPEIGLVTPSRAGTPVRSASPGETLLVSVDAIDADGDALHYAWRDGSDLVSSGDAPVIVWPLLSVEARNTLTVQVSDGRGGFARREVAINTSPTGDRFIGTVADGSGDPLANTVVSIDGRKATTDAAGSFNLSVPEGERHVLSVRQPGFALFSKTFHANGTGLDIRLQPLNRSAIDPTEPADVVDSDPSGPSIHLSANTLVDQSGNPPKSPVTVGFHPYGRFEGEEPGDRTALDTNGERRTIQTFGAMSVEISDGNGVEYHVAPGKKARISFKAPPTADPSSLPSALPLFRYDEDAGLWVESASAVLRGDRYEGRVAGFSTWSVGQFYSGDGTACLRLAIDENRLQLPFHLGVRVAGFVGEYTVTDKIDAILRLPSFSLVELRQSPADSPAEVNKISYAFTTGNVSPAEAAYPYSSCAHVTLTVGLPTDHWFSLSGDDTTGDENLATQYYQSIGASFSKPTFQSWLAANGFTSGDSANDVVFFNPNELGLGRRANCKQRRPGGSGPINVACYVTKYGEVGGSPDEALDDTAANHNPGDTVAIEWSPLPSGGERIVKFYIYGPDGKLKTHTTFDTEGSIRYVPDVCQYCHGPLEDRMVALDPKAYRYPASGPHTLANQQERLRELEADILYTTRGVGPTADLIASIYPGPSGVFAAGTKAIDPPPPDAWKNDAQIWHDVVKPSCRTCHIGLTGDALGLDFTDPQKMQVFGNGYVAGVVCGGFMPQAMAPMLRLWRSANPFLVDVFSDFIGTGRCNTTDQPPEISVTSPSDGQHFSWGGLGAIALRATATDDEDGSSCCSIRWFDAAGDEIGFGQEAEYVLPEGTSMLTAMATDSQGVSSRKTITIYGDNAPPSVEITKPTDGQMLYPDVNYKFSADRFDPNDPYLTIPCESLAWTSSHSADGQATGCQPVYRFATTGMRKIKVTGTDSEGATASDGVTVDVEPPAAASPPVPIIYSPEDGAGLDRDEQVLLDGDATDPTGTGGAITYQWTEDHSGTEVVIGTEKQMYWTPSESLPRHCGGWPNIHLRLHASDVYGVGTATVKIHTVEPPC